MNPPTNNTKELRENLHKILSDFDGEIPPTAHFGVDRYDSATQSLLECFREWRNVVGYEGLYKVSNYGEVFSEKRTNKGGLMSTNSLNAYPAVVLYKKNVSRPFAVHRLVAQAFIPNPNNKSAVNHIDGNKQNNWVKNLEWVTPKENGEHASINGLMARPTGEKNGSAKITEADVRRIRSLRAQGLSQKEIAEQYPISRQTVQAIISGLKWGHVV